MTQARGQAKVAMPRRRGVAAGLVNCGLSLMTIAAIGLSIAAVYGRMSEAALPAALGLVAFVQLSILIGNWRRATSPVAPLRAPAAADSPRMNLPRAAANDDRIVPPAGTATGTAAGGYRLDDGQFELLLEPVVELEAASTVYYRSSLALIRQDGSRVGPYLLGLGAERGGYATDIDLALFRRVCPVIRHMKARRRRAGVFCPLSPQSFAERDVLDELIRFLRANTDAAGSMVIEISQPDLGRLSPAGMDGLAHLAELGATLSLSEARLEGPDLATLVLLGFRFFDLDIAATASSHGWDAFEAEGEIRLLARRAEQAGLTVIAANVARAQELDRVRPLARLARGSLFSAPRIVRRDITEPPVQAAAA